MPKKKVDTKRIVSKTVETISPYDFDMCLNDIRKKIIELIVKYGPDARLDWDRYHHEPYDSDPSPQFNLIVSRLETDEEYANRLEVDRAYKEAQDARDLAEYRRLKEKLEGK